MFGEKIVILGAGYGGLTAAIELQRKLKKNEGQITLINQHAHHCVSTWLHKAAAGTIQPTACHVPITNLIDHSKINFIQAHVEAILYKQNKVLLNNGTTMTYDYLIISLGSEPETFGISGLKEHTWVITNIESAKRLNEHIEKMFIQYKRSSENLHDLHFVVGGAGFTGIQFVAELADRIPSYCKKHRVPLKKVKVTCVEAGPTILGGLGSSLIEYAKGSLEQKQVTFKIGIAFKECGPGYVLLSSGEKLKAGTIVWTGGVRGNSVIGKSGFDTKRGCAPVDDTLRAIGQDHVYIIGDVSHFINKESNRPYPPTAQIATQQGKLAASNVMASIRKQSLKPFQPSIRGTLVSLGKQDAVGEIFGYRLRGRKVLGIKWLVDVSYFYSIGGLRLVFKKKGLFKSRESTGKFYLSGRKLFPVSWKNQK